MHQLFFCLILWPGAIFEACITAGQTDLIVNFLNKSQKNLISKLSIYLSKLYFSRNHTSRPYFVTKPYLETVFCNQIVFWDCILRLYFATKLYFKIVLSNHILRLYFATKLYLKTVLLYIVLFLMAPPSKLKSPLCKPKKKQQFLFFAGTLTFSIFSVKTFFLQT